MGVRAPAGDVEWADPSARQQNPSPLMRHESPPSPLCGDGGSFCASSCVPEVRVEHLVLGGLRNHGTAVRRKLSNTGFARLHSLSPPI